MHFFHVFVFKFYLKKIQSTCSRWMGKLARSPYLNDLVSENEKHEQESKIRSLIEERKGKLLE